MFPSSVFIIWHSCFFFSFLFLSLSDICIKLFLYIMTYSSFVEIPTSLFLLFHIFINAWLLTYIPLRENSDVLNSRKCIIVSHHCYSQKQGTIPQKNQCNTDEKKQNKNTLFLHFQIFFGFKSSSNCNLNIPQINIC